MMEYVVNGAVLIVPEGVRKIGFGDICSYVQVHAIKEILLPSTLEIIEANAFFDLTELQKINVPPNVNKIGSQAFWGLDGLRELFVPDTVACIEKHAFCNIPQCKIVIVGKSRSIPDGWDAEFAANVKEICFASA
ncbi:MAG: leucine-rich repeat protein [Clostridia bacterium]|nr:leucine-rich repeat protein [Clostridia bacterium]